MPNLRVITNMDCNEKCYFCYQKIKDSRRLDINFLRSEIERFDRFNRAAIYGGEATIREDLTEFIELCGTKSDVVSLTSNGTLLNQRKLQQYRDAGLDELGISVPTIQHWSAMRDMPWEDFLKIIKLAVKYIPNVRINVVENKYNMSGDNYEMYDIIKFFTQELNIGVLICRNFTKKYPDLDLGLIGAELRCIENGCAKYTSSGADVSYYEPVKVYNESDYIVSPVGVFTNWMKFVATKDK
jgi:MoaA/NifB/PqqE/SkfB family radical SAM enzyme